MFYKEAGFSWRVFAEPFQVFPLVLPRLEVGSTSRNYDCYRCFAAYVSP